MSGAAINIKPDEARAVFTHLYGKCIGLAASDSTITSRIMNTKDGLKQLMKLQDSSNIHRSATQS